MSALRQTSIRRSGSTSASASRNRRSLINPRSISGYELLADTGELFADEHVDDAVGADERVKRDAARVVRHGGADAHRLGALGARAYRGEHGVGAGRVDERDGA